MQSILLKVLSGRLKDTSKNFSVSHATKLALARSLSTQQAPLAMGDPRLNLFPLQAAWMAAPVLTSLCGGTILQVDGTVLYNKKAFSKFVVERTAAYVDQVRQGPRSCQHDAHQGIGAPVPCALGQLWGCRTSNPAACHLSCCHMRFCCCSLTVTREC